MVYGRKYPWYLAVALAFQLLDGAVHAAMESAVDLKQLSLEELMEIKVDTVYSASKHEQKTTEAPSAVTIITSDEIKNYGHRTLADILRSVRSFFITYDRNYSYLGARGFDRPGDYNSRVLLLVDGHRLNDNIFDSAFYGTDFFVDVDLIDRVEIIRGPSSSLYGSNAFFGVINVITRSGADLQGVEVSAEAGSFNSYKGILSYGNAFPNGLEMLLSGSAYDSKGDGRLYYREFDDPATNSGIAEDVDGENEHHLFSKFIWSGITLEGVYSRREKTIPTASFDTVFNDPRNRTTDERFYLDLKYLRQFVDKSELAGRIYYDFYDYLGEYVYDWASPGDPQNLVLNKDPAHGRWTGGELQYTKTVFEKHNITAGAEYRDNIRQDQANYDEAPYFSYLDDQRQSTVWALFAQDDFSLHKKLILNAGVRYDHYDTIGGSINPRVALIYKPLEQTIFKILYGQAFRAPNYFEMFYAAATGFKANPDLEPEQIKTYELIYEQFFGAHLRSTLSGFHYQIENLISQQRDPADDLIRFDNVEEIEANGVELEMEGKWDNGWRGRASYTFQETENQETGETLTNSPKHLAKINLTVPLVAEKLSTGIEVQYTSERKTLDGNSTGDFYVVNVTLLSQNILPGMEASASVYNLFDKEYGDPGSGDHRQTTITQDGLNFRAKMTYRF